MTKRIFKSICLVSMSIFLLGAAIFMGILYEYFTDLQTEQLRTQTSLAAQGVAKIGKAYLQNLDADKCRISWISQSGDVLFDSASDESKMENHLEREEIKEALKNGEGESSRYSSTLMERSLYCARLLPDGSVLRLSISQNTLLTLCLGMLQPLCVVFAAALILSLIFASKLAKKIVKPLNELDLDNPLENEEYEELSPLLRRIDAQQRQICMQRDELFRKQKEFETVVSGIPVGIVLLNRGGVILSCNKAAASVMGADSAAGKNILSICRRPEINEAIESSLKGSFCEKIAEINGARYKFSANPVTIDGTVSGIVLLITDITEKEHAEQLRREFTANVSHELKTPLQTISGSAELIMNGIVKAGDIKEFANGIYSESRRMINLIDDIIKLSHLDEGAYDMKREDTDLYSLACETVKSLSLEAQKAGVSTELTGESAVINGIPRLLSGIIYNLCDNAIKYNKTGGNVTVSVKDSGNSATLTVSDTGIGIPPEERERVFERFYRVDKSRSKEIGGTGLGLSIVKHAAMLHNASVKIDGEPGKGTTFTVVFPKSGKAAF